MLDTNIYSVFISAKTPLELDKFVGSISLPQPDETLDENTQLIMTGRGTTMGSPIHPVNIY